VLWGKNCSGTCAVITDSKTSVSILGLGKNRNSASKFQFISKKMQRYTVYLYLETDLHVSGGTTTHHQERIQLYLQHLVFVTIIRCCRYSCMRSWWWVVVTPKHVKQFPDINKLFNVASCWIYVYWNFLKIYGIINVKLKKKCW